MTTNSIHIGEGARLAKNTLRIQVGGDSGAWVDLTGDGGVSFGPAYEAGSAGRAFWSGVATDNPLREENERLRAMLSVSERTMHDFAAHLGSARQAVEHTAGVLRGTRDRIRAVLSRPTKATT